MECCRKIFYEKINDIKSLYLAFIKILTFLCFNFYTTPARKLIFACIQKENLVLVKYVNTIHDGCNGLEKVGKGI